MTENFGKILIVAALGLFLGVTSCYANNLSVTNVTLGSQNPNAKTVVVSFNVSWQNSWRNKINYDAAWLTVRLIDQTTSASPVLCTVSAVGLNPAGASAGNGSNLQIYVPQDATGAFLEPSSTGFVGDINTQNVQLTINYSSCGGATISDTDQIYASVFGVEMVFIPQGSFYAGDYGTSTAALNLGDSVSSPWNVTSENTLPVSNTVGQPEYTSAGNSGEYGSGSSFTIPAAFSKGYNAFYVMKYGINEGQWVQFINSSPQTVRFAHDLSDQNHKNGQSVMYRNTVACTGAGTSAANSNIVCTTQRAARAVSYLSWMDVAAFLAWDALRPMTELEFEKIARGPLLPNAGEYVWGNQTIDAATTISGTTEDGTETITAPADANANYGGATFTGGDSSQGVGYNQGPLRGGIFAGGSGATRTSSGASYYGVMDLSGNLKDRVVTIGNASGLLFAGSEGNGVLTTAGNAANTDWPGIDQTTPANGVDTATGSGFRGGSWADATTYLRISDRSEAARTDTAALNTYGGRGVRTYDGN